MSGFTQRSVYRAATIGTAPNVPFFNMHIIMPQHGEGTDKSSGYAYSFGLRFVSFGASLIHSGWFTTDQDSELAKQLYSVSAGAAHFGLVANIELLNFRHEIEYARFAQGSVATAELKARLWRENYAMVNLAQSNIAYAFKEGSVMETMYGIKSFPIAGIDLELLAIERKIENDPTATEDAKSQVQKLIQGQVHVFF